MDLRPFAANLVVHLYVFLGGLAAAGEATMRVRTFFVSKMADEAG